MESSSVAIDRQWTPSLWKNEYALPRARFKVLRLVDGQGNRLFQTGVLAPWPRAWVEIDPERWDGLS